MLPYTVRHGQAHGQEDDLASDEIGDLVWDIFAAMRNEAPGALAALTNGPSDDNAIAKWASDHGLDFAPLIDHAAGFRRGGSTAAHLKIRIYGSDYVEWARRQKAPDPLTETTGEWRKRADRMYQDACRVTMRKPTQWLSRATHARWFVLRRVLGMNATDIAAAMKKGCDKTTIDKGIARVETALRNWRDYPMVKRYSIAEKSLPDGFVGHALRHAAPLRTWHHEPTPQPPHRG